MAIPDKGDRLRASQTKLMCSRSGLISLWPNNLSRSSPRTGLGPFSSSLSRWWTRRTGLGPTRPSWSVVGWVWFHSGQATCPGPVQGRVWGQLQAACPDDGQGGRVWANQTKLVSSRSGLIPLWPSNLSRSSPRTGLGPTSSSLSRLWTRRTGWRPTRPSWSGLGQSPSWASTTSGLCPPSKQAVLMMTLPDKEDGLEANFQLSSFDYSLGWSSQPQKWPRKQPWKLSRKWPKRLNFSWDALCTLFLFPAKRYLSAITSFAVGRNFKNCTPWDRSQ